jgi:hypothetical protein
MRQNGTSTRERCEDRISIMSETLISVILPVYNGAAFLKDSVDSILTQSHQHLELIAVDDGSTDASWDMLQTFAARDSRVRLLKQPQNMGLVAALNRACLAATGVYLARMDADDISLPDRLARQADYLDQHPDTGIVGTQAEVMDEQGKSAGWIRVPLSPGLTHWAMLFYNPLVHSSVMMRRSVGDILGYYQHWPSEDYELWARASAITRITNLPDVHLRYRRFAQNLSSTSESKTRQRATEIAQTLLIQPLINRIVDLETVAALQSLGGMPRFSSSEQITRTADLLGELLTEFRRNPVWAGADLQAIEEDAANRFYLLAASSRQPLLMLRLIGYALRLKRPSASQFKKVWRRVLSGAKPIR